MRKRSLLLLAGAAAIVASLVIGPAATAGPEKASAGTVVFIHDQEPPNLRPNWVDNSLYATSLVDQQHLHGGQIRDNNANWVRRLFTGPPKLLKKSPLTVAVHVQPEGGVVATASRSPVPTGARRGRSGSTRRTTPSSRTGYEDIKSVKCKGKTGTSSSRRCTRTGRRWSMTGVWPAHITAGKDMNKLWEDSIPVSSGPWKFQSWQKGVQITVVKNPRFTIAPMKLDRVVFRYIADTNARFQAMKAGEGQAMEPQAQLQIADFQKDKNFMVKAVAGYSYEHLDIQFGPKGAPALKAPYVRQALITGINRPQIASALYQTIAPGLPTLQSNIFKTFEKGYVKHYAHVPVQPGEGHQHPQGQGLHRWAGQAERGQQQDLLVPGRRQAVASASSTTSGNQLRALTFEIIQRQLKSVGIELVPRFQPAGLLFGTTLPSSDWDLMLFTWVESPSSKITAKDKFACGGEINYGNYCNKKATALLEQDRDRRSTTPLARSSLNQAEAMMAKDVPSIPMFVRPVFTIAAKKLKGLTTPTTLEGDFWNVNTWAVS